MAGHGTEVALVAFQVLVCAKENRFPQRMRTAKMTIMCSKRTNGTNDAGKKYAIMNIHQAMCHSVTLRAAFCSLCVAHNVTIVPVLVSR